MQCYRLKPLIQNGNRIWVPCGKCNFCLANRRYDWSFRLLQEEKESNTAHFLTLTYDDIHLPMEIEEEDGMFTATANLKKQDLYLFHKSLKQFQRRTLGKSLYEQWKIRYYSVGEYGSLFKRPHYHSILFNLHPTTIQYLEDRLNQTWNKGHIYFGTVTPASVAYVAKYVIDQEPDEFKERTQQKPFSTMSRNPGIGHQYIIHNREWHRPGNSYNHEEWRLYVINNGFKSRMPRYYKDRIFGKTEHDKEIMDTSFQLLYMELAEKFEKEYIQEIERLEQFHEQPVLYYQERLKQAHDQIRIKSRKLNKL